MRKKFLNEKPNQIDEVIAYLGGTPYFRTVDNDLLKEILLEAFIFELGAAEHLIRESNKSDRMFYILMEGEFDVVASKKFILKIDQPGTTIGEMAVLRRNAPRTADVIAVAPSKVVAIESSFLDKADAQSRKLTIAFYQMFNAVLSNKLETTTDRAKLYEDSVLEKEEIDKYNKELTEESKDLRQELQEKLSQIKLFSQVVESNLDAIAVSDLDGNIRYPNHAFIELFGYGLGEILDLNLKDLVGKPIGKQLKEKKTSLKGWKGQKTAHRKDKSSFPALLSISPVKTGAEEEDEDPVFATVIRDITLQKEYEENILKANEELKETYEELDDTYQELTKSNDMKDRFFSSISSQLKTPLDCMINYAELLKKEIHSLATESDGMEFLTHIVDEGNKMEKLVGNLITMAEITSEMKLNFKVVRFHSFIGDLKKEEKDFDNIIFDIDPEITAVIADGDKLMKAFIDIIDYHRSRLPVDGQLYFQGQQNNKKNQLEVNVTNFDPRSVKTETDFIESNTLSDGVELSIQKGELLLPLAKRIIELHQGEMLVTTDEEKEKISMKLPIDPNAEVGTKINVMIIDENEWDRRILTGIVDREFMPNEIYEFDSQMSALNALNALKPHLIIVDPFFEKSQWNYEEFLHKLIEGNQDKISTLVISDQLKDLDVRNTIISLGITDFLFKPFTIEDALFKITSIIETIQRLFLLSSNVQKAEKTAATDGMTGLFARRYFDSYIEEQFIKSDLQNGNCSIIMIDVDNFKHYNDTNGHQLGDEVLKKVARIMQTSVRQSDMAARYGGEEFVIVLPGTAKKMAENIAEKLRSTIEEAEFENEDKQPQGKLTASFGVASFPENGTSPEVVLKGADSCLYIAKEKGRNRVVAAEGVVKL